MPSILGEVFLPRVWGLCLPRYEEKYSISLTVLFKMSSALVYIHILNGICWWRNMVKNTWDHWSSHNHSASVCWSQPGKCSQAGQLLAQVCCTGSCLLGRGTRLGSGGSLQDRQQDVEEKGWTRSRSWVPGLALSQVAGWEKYLNALSLNYFIYKGVFTQLMTPEKVTLVLVVVVYSFVFIIIYLASDLAIVIEWTDERNDL